MWSPQVAEGNGEAVRVSRVQLVDAFNVTRRVSQASSYLVLKVPIYLIRPYSIYVLQRTR